MSCFLSLSIKEEENKLAMQTETLHLALLLVSAQDAP